MSHDHEAVQLAIASLDFELTPAERTRMEAGLAACDECASIAAGHAELARLLERLPVHDASPLVRQRVLRAALVPPRSRPWPILLVAAALVGLLVAAAAAAGAFRTDPFDQIVDTPSASPPALGDLESPEPSGPVSPEASSREPAGFGGSVFGIPLPVDSLAQVVSGRLRIRSEPRVADDSIKYEPLLGVGVRLFVLDGPVVANEYEWYQITAWHPQDPSASWPVGWVSRGDHDGTPWIRPITDACPTGEVTAAVVAGMPAPERVACFGNETLRFRAFISGPGQVTACVADPGCVDGPTWLAGHAGWFAAADASLDTPSTGGPPIAIDPAGAVAERSVPTGTMAEVVGAFGHPLARDCRVRGPGTADGRMTDAAARLHCRARFVVTAIEVDPAYPMANGPAITVSDRLRVRSAPGLESDRYELLALGTPVWVVQGPVTAADYDWFEVVVPGLEVDGVPRVGWVADSDHGRERWLAKRTLDCPAPERVTLADLDRLTSEREPHGGLACFGDRGLLFEGSVELTCGAESRSGWTFEPEWLGGNAFHGLAISSGTRVINAHIRPGLGIPRACDALEGSPRAVRGHFGDPDAEACDGTAPPGIDGRRSMVLVSYWCRTALVVDGIVPMPAVIPTPVPAP